MDQKMKRRLKRKGKNKTAPKKAAPIMSAMRALNGIDEKLPWPDLEVPAYREGEYENLVLERQTIPAIRGYFRGIQGPCESYRLIEREEGQGTVWMSLSPMELESQMPHLAAAKGHTVIVGAGMGVLLYNVLKKAEVEKVTVFERNPDMVSMLEEISPMYDWPGIDKLEFCYRDPLLEPIPELGEVNFLCVDIWPGIGGDEAERDTKAIWEKIRARKVAWWGMELSFFNWVMQQRVKGPLNQTHWSRWRSWTGMPLITVPVSMAYRAAANSALAVREQSMAESLVKVLNGEEEN